MPKPTKQDYEAAKRVLRFLMPHASKLAEYCDQETPTEWARGLETTLELLRNGDPLKELAEYREEYDAGH
jgi:hypothetical protein